MNKSIFWPDGEKIPKDFIGKIFQPAPGVPNIFSRSALITGGRGAGKTTLLRYHKEIHDGTSVRLSLPELFPSISQETGHGFLSLASEFPKEEYSQISGKALSLLAATIALALSSGTEKIEALRELKNCLPASLRSESIDYDWLASAKSKLSERPLREFDRLFESFPLTEYLAVVSTRLQQETISPLLILLDRADMVPTPCLAPVFELLDQSAGYILLVAMRPSHSPYLDSLSVAGDHYDVFHVGAEPRSFEWINFLDKSVEAQMRVLDRTADFEAVDKDWKRRIFSVSRDSTRTALTLFNKAMESPSKATIESAITGEQRILLSGARSSMQRYHLDYDKFLALVRSHAMSRYGSISGPLIVNIQASTKETFFESSRIQKFVDGALRADALCIPSGQHWTPGLQPLRLEVPPIFVWEPSDTEWAWNDAIEIEVDVTEDAIFRGARGVAVPPSVFIAYRMKDGNSLRFRQVLEKAIDSSSRLPVGTKVLDGHVYAGSNWAVEIRKRLRGSRVVVGDVTGMRPDVCFELGLARGWDVPTIPIVMGNSEDRLPEWITSIQNVRYSGDEDVDKIIGSILGHLSDPSINRKNRLPHAVPGALVWLRRLAWNSHSCDRFTTFAKRNGFGNTQVLTDENDEEQVVVQCAKANILVASMDGTEKDALVHFICGAVIARPRAGVGGALRRHIILLCEKSHLRDSLVAQSLSLCKDVVSITTPDQLDSHLNNYLDNYRRWVSVNDDRARKNRRH